MALEHEALTERIMEAAIEVHRLLGPGFLESVWFTTELRQDNARTQVSHCFLRLFLPSCLPSMSRPVFICPPLLSPRRPIVASLARVVIIRGSG
jgi:PD-(D/E)XK nuclease superfamily